mmetsp:Transcript_217/g.622  ORF Transcript_217/g.622 Transcript_217/m.622 type:complete len:171 (-) Transcript_217:629-1141(-)|eukprot:CAMPEP_0115844978 /NCGR_PEP_ID=MMETSP0287-20121206/9108_1 /TAXON_ID=412157 /ORGANISM="Chrysochromulina rotalis, Strain UIO044" /LENGTH=170 /DNA_ID=CAMNT_0003298723 /DNA_START=329 /DNA_END=841 /DNA_ORIENTATION=+
MKPDWEELGEKYEKSKKILIGDVDCTADSGKALCERFDVKGYPTLKYFEPGDTVGSAYEGDRDLESLKAFVKTLGPSCGPSNKKKCSPEQLTKLEEYMTMPSEDLEQNVLSTRSAVDEAKAKHDALMKSLQDQYQASEAAFKALNEKHTAELKLMRAVLTQSQAAAEKPE